MYRILKFGIGMLGLTLILSCGEKPIKEKKSEFENYISGLASPIKLNFDSTQVFLTDYFPEAKAIEKVIFENQELISDSISGELIITQKPTTPLSNLHVVYKGVDHDIPVFNSNKVKHHFTYKPSSAKVKIIELSGSMNGWNRKATPLSQNGEEFSTDLILNSGMYQYRIWEDGKEMMDANNPEKIDNGMGAFNNTFMAGAATDKMPRIISTGTQQGAIELSALDPLTNIRVYFENKAIEFTRDNSSIHIRIPNEAKLLARSHIRVFADNGVQRSNDILIPLEKGDVVQKATQLNRRDIQATIMYFAMVDRFADGDSSNNRPTIDSEILPQANNLGGDLDGITQKIKDGYFKNLGINTIWISPITKNAEGAWGLWDKGVRSKFSAYHGYWPTSLRSIDDRLGDDASLKKLIQVSHENDMNVILDYVAHHVHQDHPLYKQKPEWTTPLYLPDGTMNTEKWDEHRLTTWFDTFLPTWKFENHEVVEALTDTAMYWIENYELDGFRHDATKHINEDFWRTLTSKVKKFTTANPDRKIYQIGETYGNPELISSYINSGELDAQFDFNLYDAEVDAFAKDKTDFKNLERVLNESMSYYGSHHKMGNITGNQDRARFISYADGSLEFSEDAKLAGWTRDIQNKNKTGYQKLAMMNAFLMTAPGVPCVYYGDEIGMPGGNDPDNRRMMHFDDWNEEQRSLQETTASLIKLRRENLALTYGDLFILKNDEEAFVFVRSYFGQNVMVVMDKHLQQNENWTLEIPAEFKSVAYRSLIGNHYEISNGVLKQKTGSTNTEFLFEIFY
jgi:cyclomaltodextrinase